MSRGRSDYPREYLRTAHSFAVEGTTFSAVSMVRLGEEGVGKVGTNYQIRSLYSPRLHFIGSPGPKYSYLSACFLRFPLPIRFSSIA